MPARAPRPLRRLRPSLPGAPASYWARSRAPRHSLLFALPLLLLYEGLAALLGDVWGVGVRNGADVWLKTPFLAVLGPRGPAAFAAVVVIAAAWAIWRDVRGSRARIEPRLFPRMLAESALVALLCALVVGWATTRLLGVVPAAVGALGDVAPGLAGPPAATAAPALAQGGVAGAGRATQLMVALGAGLYEELLFRVVLVGTIAALGRRVLGLSAGAAGAIAVGAGALLFSAAHHVGPLGEPVTLAAFAFRTLAGLFFSASYVLRGFGITAWAHALYDVGVLLLT